MTVIQRTQPGTSVLIYINVLFCFLALLSPGNAIAEVYQNLENNNTSIKELALEGKTDTALEEYQRLVLIKGKEDLPLLRDISRGILRKNWEKTINILGDLEDNTAIQFFISALQSNKNRVAEAATEALRKFGDERAVPPLINAALCHRDSKIRKAALNTLTSFNNNGLINSSHVPALLQSFQQCTDVDDTSLSFAVKIMGEIGDKHAVPILQELFGSMIAPSPRASSILSPEDVVRTLNMLGDHNSRDKLEKTYREGNDKQRIKAALALGKLGDTSVVPLLMQTLKDKNTSEEVTVNTITALSFLGAKEAIPILTETLNDKSGWVREQSAVALYELNQWKYFPRIIKEMTANKSIPESVIMSLTPDDGNAVRFLMNLLGRGGLSSNEYIRVVDLLNSLGDARAVPTLVQSLKDYKSPRRHARVIIANTLGNIGDKRAVPGLIDALKDRDDMRLVKTAMESLYKLGDKRAVSALISELQDDDGFYKSGTATIRVNEDSHFIFSDEKDINRGIAAMILGKFGDRDAVPVLINSFLDNSSYFVDSRIKIAEALGELGDKRAVPALVDVLYYEKDQKLIKEAAMALAKLGEKNAIPILIQGFKLNINDDDRMMMVHCISEFGLFAAPHLLKALNDEDILERTWSARSLGEIYSKIKITPMQQTVKNTPLGDDKEPDIRKNPEGLKGKSGNELMALLRTDNPLTIEAPSNLKDWNGKTDLSKVRKAMSGQNTDFPPEVIPETKKEQGKSTILNLTTQLEDKNPLMKYEAAGDLQKTDFDPGTPVSVEPRNDKISTLKDVTAEESGKEAGFQETLRSLRNRLKDPFENVRFASAEALWRIVDFVTDPPTSQGDSEVISE
ncbi:MAG: HEAT repeat domain-containing protein [Proteobacteria bacterium]|nr:HEAT repeat domain-containing protein [Pseudomonadota bacterium]MBU1688725.1 HEAT repeat domain-containing protein [Pseudomonadota bacterium]